MVEVTKNLENRHQALKWIAAQENGFIYKDVTSKFHVPTTFMAAAVQKALISSGQGRNCSKWIGPAPSIHLAVEVYDYERQMLGRKPFSAPKKMVDTEGLGKWTDIVQKATEQQSESKVINKIINRKTSPLSVTIENGKVIMDWKDFSNLIETYGTKN